MAMFESTQQSKQRQTGSRLLASAVLVSTLLTPSAAFCQSFNFAMVAPRSMPTRPTAPSMPVIALPPTPPPVAPPAPPPNIPIVQPINTSNQIKLPNLNLQSAYPILVPLNIPIKFPKKPKKPTKSKTSVATKKSDAKKELVVQKAPEVKAPQPTPVLPGIFQFSMDCGNGLCNQDNQFEMIPGRGSLYSLESANSINLARGHMVIIAGDIEVNLKAGRLKAKVASGCAMVAEVSPDGTTRMFSLPSFQATHGDSMIQTPDEMGGEKIAVKPGTQFVLSGRAQTSEEFIAVDGLALGPVEGGLTLSSNGHLHLVKYSMKRMRENEILIGCRRVSLPTERLNKVREAIAKAADSEESTEENAKASTNAHIQPVSFGEVPLQTTAPKLNHQMMISSKTTTLCAEAGTLVDRQSEQSVQLIKGTLLGRSTTPFNIKAFGAQVQIAKGAIALVRVQDHFVKVVNLTDLAKDTVSVRVGDKVTTLLPGREMILSDCAPSLTHVFDVHDIGHRTIITQQLNEQIWTTTSEIALADELVHQPLMRWLHVQHMKQDDQIINSVVKTAAVLETIMRQADYVRGELDDESDSGTATMVAGACQTCSH